MDQLFSGSEFSWSFRMRREEPHRFFEPLDTGGELVAQRNHWLDHAPELCLAKAESGDQLISELWTLAENWRLAKPDQNRDMASLARQWEADYILLDAETFTLAAGCVCFPSSWDLQGSVGKTLNQIHGAVPGLTEQIGDKIDRFLRKLPANQAFLRENWSLTRSSDLNYHPALKRPKLDPSVTASDVFLRIEHQAFVKLPSGVLMGIRIEPVGLETLNAEHPTVAEKLRGQLETMPEEVAIYKGLAAGRARVCELLPQKDNNKTSG